MNKLEAKWGLKRMHKGNTGHYIAKVNYLFSLKHFIKSWTFWLIFGISLGVILFSLWVLPIIILKADTINQKYTLYYGGGTWLLVTFPAIIVVLIAYGSFIGWMNANNKENIYILTKTLKRSHLLVSKCLSSLTITLPISIFLYLFFVCTNAFIKTQYVHSPDESYTLFTDSITWWGLLFTIIICSLFSCLNTIMSYCINGALSLLGITIVSVVFFILMPMICDDIGSSNPQPMDNTSWYTTWTWVFIFLPVVCVVSGILFHYFVKVRINI